MAKHQVLLGRAYSIVLRLDHGGKLMPDKRSQIFRVFQKMLLVLIQGFIYQKQLLFLVGHFSIVGLARHIQTQVDALLAVTLLLFLIVAIPSPSSPPMAAGGRALFIDLFELIFFLYISLRLLDPMAVLLLF